MSNTTQIADSIKDHEIQLAQHKHQTFRATPKFGTSPEEMLESRYWVSVANKLRAGDEISVLAQDNSFYMRLVVLFVNGNDVRVEPIMMTKMEVDDSRFDEHPDFEVKNGGATGFYIRDKRTGERVKVSSKASFAKRSEAYKALEQYLKKIAA